MKEIKNCYCFELKIFIFSNELYMERDDMVIGSLLSPVIVDIYGWIGEKHLFPKYHTV